MWGCKSFRLVMTPWFLISARWGRTEVVTVAAKDALFFLSTRTSIKLLLKQNYSTKRFWKRNNTARTLLKNTTVTKVSEEESVLFAGGWKCKNYSSVFWCTIFICTVTIAIFHSSIGNIMQYNYGNSFVLDQGYAKLDWVYRCFPCSNLLKLLKLNITPVLKFFHWFLGIFL